MQMVCDVIHDIYSVNIISRQGCNTLFVLWVGWLSPFALWHCIPRCGQSWSLWILMAFPWLCSPALWYKMLRYWNWNCASEQVILLLLCSYSSVCKHKLNVPCRACCVCVCSVCIFCGEQNDEFTEEGLDVHYWKNCPVLKRCQHCRQVCQHYWPLTPCSSH